MEKELSITINSVMKNIFMLMSMALVLTGFVSYYVMNNDSFFTQLIFDKSLLTILLIIEFILVFTLSAFIKKLSFNVALIMFTLYSISNGITLSPILYLYTQESITSTFFITSATFATMAIIGYTTKKDLTTVGNILIISLVGIIIATIVNFFINSSLMAMLINYAGVLIFIGLTAYDTQKIKKITEEYYNNGESNIIPKLSVIGALSLYLDFINLFIELLELMGKRK